MKRQTQKTLSTAIVVLLKAIDKNSDGLSATTIRGYKDGLTIIQKYYEDKKLKDITAAEIKTFLNETLLTIRLEKSGNKVGYSTKTRINVRLMLMKLFAHFCSLGELRLNPFIGTTINVVDREDMQETESYTLSELEELAQVRDGDGVVEKMLFDAEMMCRVAESSAITTDSVDLKRGIWYIDKALVNGAVVSPKTNCSKRAVRLSPLAVQIIAERIATGKTVTHTYALKGETKTSEFVFFNPKTNKVWGNNSQLYRASRKYVERAGVKFRGNRPMRKTGVENLTDRYEELTESGHEFSHIPDHKALQVLIQSHIGHATDSTISRHYQNWKKNIRTSRQLLKIMSRSTLTQALKFKEGIIDKAIAQLQTK
ncbi:hypothetical protein [Vibrio bivalvicida]|uniref:Core-binding (CB) domain-containing protein n=1 Tax=Vibrio bivalvicida TaxID=1276888 RepID=A0ABV4MMD1_9VIBR